MVLRLAKSAARLVWRATSPARRPLRARFDARIEALVSNAVDARLMPPLIEAMEASGRRLGRIEEAVASANRSAAAIAEEMDLVHVGVSRDLVRLEAQLVTLRAMVEGDGRELAPGLSIVAESADDAPSRRTTTPERSKVG